MRQQAEALVRAVSAFRLSLNERIEQPAVDLRAGTAEPRLAASAPPADLRASSKPAVPLARKSTPALTAAAGDDWEEF
jgi:hypothetical protein